MTADGKLQIVLLLLAIIAAIATVLIWSKQTNAQKKHSRSEDSQ